MAENINIWYYVGMIGRIKGKIVFIGDKFLIVDTGGVGYKVFVNNETIIEGKLNNETSLWTYTSVRENAIDLYGFLEMESLSFFELLLDVSGIGPKSAISILNIAPIETLAKAIATGDTSYLNKVSGIGRKTAEKIVLELRDKLSAWKGENIESLKDEGDVIEALKALGYSPSEARNALKKVSPETTGTNNRVKEALRLLNTRT